MDSQIKDQVTTQVNRKITNLGELKASGYQSKTLTEELRSNLNAWVGWTSTDPIP